MSNASLPTLAALLTAITLLFVAAPAAHAEPAGTPACNPAAVTAHSLTATLFFPVLEPLEAAEKDQRSDGPTAQATCDAQCHDGSTIWCWGSSCNAEDSNCSSSIQGSCWGTDTGTKYCPVCPVSCEPGATCSRDEDCNGGFCDKEPSEIAGSCVC